MSLQQSAVRSALLAAPSLFLGFYPSAAGAFTFNLQTATIADIDRALDSGALTSVQLTQLYLNRIEAYEPLLNALITIDPRALETAAALDLERQTTGARGPLHGIPIILKDNIDTFNMATTAGFLGLKDSLPPDDAFIANALREAGAIVLGKASLTEFANFLTSGMPAGYSSLNDYTFNPYNPVTFPPTATPPNNDGRPLLSPGGSSAGSGASMAAEDRHLRAYPHRGSGGDDRPRES